MSMFFAAVLYSPVIPATTALPVEEILNLQKLGQKTTEFAISRDIFSPDIMMPRQTMQTVQPVPAPRRIEEPPDEEKPKVDPKVEIENEIKRSVFYEGYIIKYPKNFALVSANGEFFAVGDGDVLMEKIKIIKIDKKAITVEVDSVSFQIQLKGDDSNE
jgi:hypothetical protein